MLKRKKLSSEEAVEDILKFVCEESGDEDSKFDKLYGDDEDINLDIERDNDNDVNNEVDENNSSDKEIVLLAPVERCTHRRKKLTYSRNVNSIDSALSEENYDIIQLPAKQKKIVGHLLQKNQTKGKKTNPRR